MKIQLAISTNKIRNVTLLADVADFLRKHKITTQVFGASWGSHRQEKKMKVSNVAYKTPQEFMTAMERDYNFTAVQIIGQEAILCGRLAIPGASAAGQEKLALLHSKLDVKSTSIDLTFRTMEAPFSEALLKFFSAYLK